DQSSGETGDPASPYLARAEISQVHGGIRRLAHRGIGARRARHASRGADDRACPSAARPPGRRPRRTAARGRRRPARPGRAGGGAVLPAFALRHPRRVAGLVMLAPVTHPWTTGVAWYHNLAATPVIGPLFGYTLALPIALAMLKPAARGVFLPQMMPDSYVSA